MLNSNHTTGHRPMLRACTGLLAIALGMQLVAQGTIDATFNIGTGADNRVSRAVMQLDGKVIIGGTFQNYNGSATGRVARLLRTGALDGSFNTGAGANGAVNALLALNDGKVMVSGQFTQFDGQAYNRIVRLEANGSIDVGFTVGTGFNGLVSDMAVQPDGKVICVGDFTSYNGTARNRVARLNTDGSLDTGFNPGTGANFLVATVALQQNGQFLIGGFFNNYNGSVVIGMARINDDGTLDNSYNLGGSGLNNAVNVIKLQPDGKAVVGGVFTTYNGTGRARIMRLNVDGSLDTGFNPGTGANNEVLAMAIQSDGAVVLGGLFTTFNGTTRQRLCRVAANGSLDGAWTSSAGAAVNTLLWIPEGRIIAGGLFTTIAGSSRNRVARLNALCTDQLELTITTDGAGSETAWEVIPVGYNYAAFSGSGLPNNTNVLSQFCLAHGCYTLRVTDLGGNGITDGGYVLRSSDGERIIDNTANFGNGSLSTISGSQGGPLSFCMPVSASKPIYSSRDKIDWKNNQVFVVEQEAAVAQVWNDFALGSPERANTGFDIWFFDPNGGYSFVRQRRHNVSDGFSNIGADRVCHLRLNGWAAADQLQEGRLYNVRVRPVVLGVAGDWGPAYRVKVDPLRSECPLTKLMDIPSNQFLSCGQTRNWGRGNYVHARPVSGANRYQFRFSLAADGYSVTRTVNTYFVQLNWTGDPPLEAGKTYDVEVRVSRDGGATWCTEYVPPALDPWGDICLLTINSSMAPSLPGDARLLEDEDMALSGPAFFAYPNPTQSGEVLRIGLANWPADQQLVHAELIDALGRAVQQRSFAVEAPDQLLEWGVNGDLVPGAYILRVGGENVLLTQRIVVVR